MFHVGFEALRAAIATRPSLVAAKAKAFEALVGRSFNTVLIERMGLAKPDTGAIYRTLQELEQEGAVVFEWDTSGSGPAKKVYRLTPAGWTKLEEWRQEIEARLANLQGFLERYRALTRAEG